MKIMSPIKIGRYRFTSEKFINKHDRMFLFMSSIINDSLVEIQKIQKIIQSKYGFPSSDWILRVNVNVDKSFSSNKNSIENSWYGFKSKIDYFGWK